MQEREWRERALRDAIASGDERAWQTLYDEEYPPLRAYVLWRCGGAGDLADDVLQETWMNVVRIIRKFRPETGSFRNWIRGVAAQTIRTSLRSRSRRERGRSPLPAEIASDDAAIADRERASRIAIALDRLQERHEAVLRRKYVDQLSVSEIAAETGDTEKAIESLLTRARAAFREAYGDD